MNPHRQLHPHRRPATTSRSADGLLPLHPVVPLERHRIRHRTQRWATPRPRCRLPVTSRRHRPLLLRCRRISRCPRTSQYPAPCRRSRRSRMWVTPLRGCRAPHLWGAMVFRPSCRGAGRCPHRSPRRCRVLRRSVVRQPPLAVLRLQAVQRWRPQRRPDPVPPC